MGKQGKHIYSTKCKLVLSSYRTNVFVGPEEEKIMMTGLHKVCDVHCKNCLKVIGWTYVKWDSNLVGVCLWTVREI